MNYTDGNWSVERHYGSKTTPSRVTSWVLYSDLDDEDHSPEDCLGEIYGPDVTTSELEANAHLCAAAPLLYEALRMIRGFIEDGTLALNMDDYSAAYWRPLNTTMDTALRAVDKALAHARGEKT